MSAGFSMRLSEVTRTFNAAPGNASTLDQTLTGVSTDSRTVKGGELFVALSGANFDGHAYVARAAEFGAAAALVSRIVADVTIPQILVSDTRLALGRLAQVWRRRFTIPVLALTGSNGKTTVKEMLRAILAAHLGNSVSVLATEGNLNNDIGVPQMLLRLGAHHKFAIFELGMNHLGEIGYLTRLVEPDAALVIMAGTAHIGELGSRDAIAEAKGEIFTALKPDGIAVINMHDRYGTYWKGLAGHRPMISFGVSDGDDVSAKFAIAGHDRLTIGWQGNEIDVHLNVPGEHNQRNALAAAAGALSLGVPLAVIKSGLEAFTGVAGRLQTYRGHNSATIIDDTYNANPDSVKAAIAVLAKLPPPRILVLGDMGELGRDGPAMHADVVAFARDAGIESFCATGDLMRDAINVFGEGAEHFAQVDTLASTIKSRLTADTHVLVKGSRFMAMERVVAQLVPNYHGGNH
ncbi:MAG: UDP-N-acetylmuramoyl-tripeptide--D-alanyl-D-alanine ligase [Burkholderiales bacterium]|nr:UDP-N-acetylmuramoyl-tripeptide--D-alanyl-D-alanine ligase [Burkholderiales bacterium]